MLPTDGIPLTTDSPDRLPDDTLYRMAMAVSVDVVIVNWNGGAAVATAVESARRFGAHVFVVDNGSTDGSDLLPADPEMTLVRMGYNAGFARASNAGARAGTGDYIFLLNPDAEILSGGIADIEDAFSSHEDAGVVGPRIVDGAGQSLPSVRRFPTTTALLLYQLKLHPWAGRFRALREYLMIGFDDARPAVVDQVIGAAFIVPRRLWDAFGGLDEGFFLLFEEVDLARRLASAGHPSVHWPNIVVRHEGHASFRRISHLRMQRVWNRSLIRYSSKHLGRLSTLALACTVPTTLVLSAILDLAGRQNAAVRVGRR